MDAKTEMAVKRVHDAIVNFALVAQPQMQAWAKDVSAAWGHFAAAYMDEVARIDWPQVARSLDAIKQHMEADDDGR